MAKRKKKSVKKVPRIIYDDKKIINNKSRKGRYVKIKEKGKPQRLYKWKEGLTKKDYMYYYRHGLSAKKIGVSPKKIKAEKKLDRLYKKHPKVDEMFKGGVIEYEISNAKVLTPNKIRESYKGLIMNKQGFGDKKPAVIDKKFTDLLTRSDIIDKWKQRVMFEVSLINSQGQILASIYNTNVKMLGQVKREIVDVVKIGVDFESQYKLINQAISKGDYRIASGSTRSGKVSNIKIKMVFRKA